MKQRMAVSQFCKNQIPNRFFFYFHAVIFIRRPSRPAIGDHVPQLVKESLREYGPAGAPQQT